MICRECGREIDVDEAVAFIGRIWCDECYAELVKYAKNEYNKFLNSFADDYKDFVDEVVRG